MSCGIIEVTKIKKTHNVKSSVLFSVLLRYSTVTDQAYICLTEGLDKKFMFLLKKSVWNIFVLL